MIAQAFLLGLLAASARPKPAEPPLLAALVVRDQIFVVDASARSVTPLDLHGLLAEEADLSPDHETVAFNAKAQPSNHSKLMLFHLADQTTEQIRTGLGGEERFPRFSADGATLYFAAAVQDRSGGPANPLRLWRMRMSDRSLTQVPTPPHRCNFSPVGLAGGRVAYLTTSCFIGFQLAVVDPERGSEEVFANVNSPRSELAASPDGSTVVYTSQGQDGLTFFAARPKRERRRLFTLVPTQARLQPRFIGYQRLIFANQDRIWSLDTSTAAVKELVDLTKPLSGKGLKLENGGMR